MEYYNQFLDKLGICYIILTFNYTITNNIDISTPKLHI
jgi:hypothetical protein